MVSYQIWRKKKVFVKNYYYFFLILLVNNNKNNNNANQNIFNNNNNNSEINEKNHYKSLKLFKDIKSLKNRIESDQVVFWNFSKTKHFINIYFLITLIRL